MIHFEEAIALILARAPHLPSEPVRLEELVGRVSARAITSPENIPPFANSAMDGFALCREDFTGIDDPVAKVCGIIPAGRTVDDSFTPPHAGVWEIMTGAAIPPRCNAVIKVEETTREGTQVRFSRLPNPQENIRDAGSDFRKGESALAAGTRLFPEHVMALASLGVERADVYRRPRVSVLSTGSELSDDASRAGMIRNSTGPYLMQELRGLGAETAFLGTVADEPTDFIRRLERNLSNEVDVVISTGAVSMGRYDFVASALRDLGAEIVFHKVAIRPGKPLLFARIGKTAFFGVPGNPIATSVGLRFFVEPYLRAIQGLPREVAQKSFLANDTKKPEGLRCFFKAETSQVTPRPSTKTLQGQESFRVAPLLAANSWAILPEQGGTVVAGTEIETYPMHSWAMKERT